MTISILDNDVVEEPEVFIGILGILPGEVSIAPGVLEQTRVTILDNDGRMQACDSSWTVVSSVVFLYSCRSGVHTNRVSGI